MSLETGYVKLYRSFKKWEWYEDTNTVRLFLHLMLSVSIKDSKWQGITIKRGETVTSIPKLARETRLSQRQVRTAISHLEMTGSLTRSKYPKFTVFTLLNFDKFQQATSKTQANRQSSDKLTTGKRQQYKNNKKIKEDIKNIRSSSPGLEPPGLLPIGESHIGEGGDF
jgi:hypothetical protein